MVVPGEFIRPEQSALFTTSMTVEKLKDTVTNQRDTVDG